MQQNQAMIDALRANPQFNTGFGQQAVMQPEQQGQMDKAPLAMQGIQNIMQEGPLAMQLMKKMGGPAPVALFNKLGG